MFTTKETASLDHHHRFMFQAFQLAEIAFEQGEVPVGAVVVKDKKIIGKGFNQVEQLQDPTAHAEMIAITAACSSLGQKYLNECAIYVTLEPCPMCAGAIVWSKPKRLVFGALDIRSGACGSIFNLTDNRHLNHRVEVIQGIMEDDCSRLLKEFFAGKRSSGEMPNT